MRSPPPRDEHRLPRYLTSFVGREHEVAQILALLARDDVRLITLLGPGGAGKTRLAVEAAARHQPSRDDVVFVSLATVQDPALVLPAIATALGLQSGGVPPADQAVTLALKETTALLVLDNLDAVTAAAPDLGRLLADCPGITILVTSRVALRLSGEHVIRIQPLRTPGPADLDPEHLAQVESVRLFLERASAAGQHISLVDEHARAVARICQRLDGLPLAIELAAAQCALLSPPALEVLLQRGAGALGDGPRDAPARHRSMHDAIAWSYDLLPPHEQAVFRRLSVFRGGFSLDAAEAVVDLTSGALGTLTSLAGQSLVVPMPSDSPAPRFSMLETIREFAAERLAAEGEEIATRDRHARFFLDRAIDREYAWCIYPAEGLPRVRALIADQANMRAALGWLDTQGDVVRGLRLAGALSPLWIETGSLVEGRAWLEKLLADPRATIGPERATALVTLSWICLQQGNWDASFARAEEGLAIPPPLHAPVDLMRCLVLAGVTAANTGQYPLAIERLDTALERLASSTKPPWINNILQIALFQLALVELTQGRIDAAAMHTQAACDVDTERGFEPGTSHIYSSQVLSILGLLARARGEHHQALELFRRHLELAVRYGVVNFQILAILDIAGTLAYLGDVRTAARFFGASEALHTSRGWPINLDLQRALGMPEPWAREDAPCGRYETLRRALRPRTIPVIPPALMGQDIDAEWARGREMTLDEAIAEALATLSIPDGDAPAHDLTPREIDVIRLIADGHSNRAIADTLSLSERTVEHHVTHILAKLDLDSRTAAATYAVRNGLL